eukprot:TRINITY_DN45344_c0_g1_i1.p1 TRINITY_DN45344_c0_g1~~TRINITY_DN45344_c0_g1_i1.p1  ORF type:complete len:952 (-),score=99.80 TRINITY_DN45344_c0_g1_i1:132-2987(-)
MTHGSTLRCNGVSELGQLNLGDLYDRACQAISCSADRRLIDALNALDPKSALLELIASHLVPDAAGDGVSGNSISNVFDNPLQKDTLHGIAGEIKNGVSVKAEDRLSSKRKLERVLQDSERASCASQVHLCLKTLAQMSLYGEDAESHICIAHKRLADALDTDAKHACRRQADRQAKRVKTALPASVRTKIEMPAVCLSVGESRDCLVSCVEYGKIQARQAESKDVVVVLGNTGAGKSAFINLLHGCTFELNAEDRMAVQPESEVGELMKIGHTNKSETFAPQVEMAASSFGDGFAFADCPGFLDNRGFEINVANAVNVKQTLAAAATVRIVVIINYHSLLADRGKGVSDLLHILGGLFGDVESLKKHADSVILAISQAPTVHPETGKPMSLASYQKKLLDPSGLDDEAKQFLSAIGDANVILYHLLGRGDSTWLQREAMIERIKILRPIEEPSSLFQSAINDSDKESLRDLVHQLGDEVKRFIDSGEYEAAADIASDLFELNLVGHSFISSLVDTVIDALIGERMSTVRSMIEDPRENAGDKVDNDETTCIDCGGRFESARRELRSMCSVLTAFAGIEEVREKIKLLLIDTMCQFQGLVRNVAFEAGRKEVEDLLRDVLRSVGDNVVREVLEIPKAAEAMKAKQIAEYKVLEDSQASELRSLSDGASTDALEILHDRHATQLQELCYREEASLAMWSELIDNANTNLKERDQTLLTEEGEAFWTKVGWSSDRLCNESATTFVNWGGKRLGDSDCDVISTVLRQLGGPPGLRMLSLSTNAIGDAGIAALSDATHYGAFCNIEKLYMNNNKFGDLGFTEFCGVLAAGLLPALKFLDVNSNRIGNAGFTALSSAIARGALSNLEVLYMHCNVIGDVGVQAFAESLVSHAVLARLEKLWLYDNKIDKSGMALLTQIIEKGNLPALTTMQLEGNSAKNSYDVQRHILVMLKSRLH